MLLNIKRIINQIQGFGIGSYVIAIVVLIIGYWVAKFAKKALVNVLSKPKTKIFLARYTDSSAAASIGNGLGSVLFWLVMIFVINMVLDILGFSSASNTLSTFFNKIISFIPDLIAAGLLFIVAYALAFRVCKPILSGLLGGIKLPQGLNIDIHTVSSVHKAIVTTVSAFVFLLMLPASLDKLHVTSISEPIKSLIGSIMDVFPSVLGALIILGFSFFIAKIVRDVLQSVLEAAKVDTFPAKLGLKSDSQLSSKKPSEILSYVVYVSIIVIAISQAAQALNLRFLSDITFEFSSAFFNIIGALVILVLGVVLARLAANALVGQPKIATVARYAIIFLAGTIALDRANLAPEITSTGFQLLLGGVAIALGVGGALALGLGGKEFVAEKLKRWNA